MSENDIGDNLTESDIEKYIEWQIPNILSLPQKVGDSLESPPIDFLGATWNLIMFPRGNKGCSGSRHITVFLCSHLKSRDIQYRIGIKKNDGSEYMTSSKEVKFVDYAYENESDESECAYDESGCEYDEFDSEDGGSESDGNESEEDDDESSRREADLVKRSVLRKKSNVLLPKGVLTMFCILRTNKASTQPEINDDFEILSADYRDLFLSGNESDVTLKVLDCEFRVHKNILRARSKVFNSMFTHDMKENNTGIVTIPDCLPGPFEDFLMYMYCGKVDKISANNVFGLYQVSDKYDVVQLKRKCVQYMMDSLSVEIFRDVLELAFRHNESALVEKASDFFVNNEKEIIVGAQWLSFLKDHPVEANNLHIKAAEKRNP